MHRMHHTMQCELMRVRGLIGIAKPRATGWLKRRDGRHPQQQWDRHPVTGHPAILPVRLALATLGARSL